jgi:hypothetical protein
MSEEWEDTQQDLREKDQAGYQEANCQIFCHDVENVELDHVEESAPLGAENQGLDTVGLPKKEENLAPWSKKSRNHGSSGHRERGGERKLRKVDDCNTSGSASKLTASCSGWAPLRRERA